jgi:peptide/nickel transport system permease protein
LPPESPVAAAPGAPRRLLRLPRLAFLGSRHRTPVVTLSLAYIALVVLVALLAPLVAPADPVAQDFERLLAPGSPGHLLGTDNLGRDQLSRLLHGARPVLVVSTASVVLATVLGTAIGLVAGFRGGLTNGVLMRSMDALLSFPLILLGIMVVAVLGTGVRNLVLAVTIALFPVVARLVQALALRESDLQYVDAARASGFGPLRIMAREVLPNLIGPVVVQATSLFAVAAGFATALSYLGLGIVAPTADWGLMVREGQEFIGIGIDLALVPGLCVTFLLVAVSFVGDFLRDVLDPDQRLGAV